MFGVSKSAAARIIDHLGPALALQQRNRFREDTVLIVDGTLAPTRDHSIAEQSNNYRYSTDHEVVIDADTRLVVAAGRPLPGNRNDSEALLGDTEGRLVLCLRGTAGAVRVRGFVAAISETLRGPTSWPPRPTQPWTSPVDATPRPKLLPRHNGYPIASEKLTFTATTAPDASRSADTGK